MSESSNSVIESLQGFINARLLDVNTSIPGVIVSYADGLARVQPTGKKRFADGDTLDYPIIPGVRVCWPSFAGGTAGVKGPIRPGDRCLLVFSQQAIDGTDDMRLFDLSDAYAVMVDLGNVGGDSGNNDSMTMYFGAASIRITEAGAMIFNAPGGATFNSPSTTNTGILTGQEVLAGDGTSLSTHVHSGVQFGPSNTGQPV